MVLIVLFFVSVSSKMVLNGSDLVYNGPNSALIVDLKCLLALLAVLIGLTAVFSSF